MKLQDGFKLLKTYAQVEHHVDAVSSAADGHKKELGWVQRSIFSEFARRDELWVIVAERDGLETYCGHLMFQRRFPRAQVVQIYVGPLGQRRGFLSSSGCR